MTGFIFTILSSFGFYISRDHPALDFTYPDAAWHVPAFLESPVEPPP